ncbi:MAG: signal recognition particle-docking protein FtsY [Saprospiraceae bacterium]|nr:signal recognition particle-docking protein FtsY [Saprospiraceae bacterium]
MGIFNKIFGKKEEEKEQLKEDLDKGLEKTRKGFFGKLATTFAGRTTIDEEVLDDLEDILIASDVGVDTTIKIIERIEERVSKDKYVTTAELNEVLKDEIVQLLAENNSDELVSYDLPNDNKPYVILVVGVNGVGKTTSIGKLANKYLEAGKTVVLGAADTFRAAAVDQLEIWANRVGCDFYSKGMNTDPAAVAYETVRYAKEKGHDLVLIDTAGRLHNKKGLMRELQKINNAIGKQAEGAPDEVMLVLDGSTGQNAYEQAKHFAEVTSLTSLALTKLDGTAKGGVVIGISDQLKIPIKYIGVGEGMHHLQEFDKREFVDSFFKGTNL